MHKQIKAIAGIPAIRHPATRVSKSSSLLRSRDAAANLPPIPASKGLRPLLWTCAIRSFSRERVSCHPPRPALEPALAHSALSVIVHAPPSHAPLFRRGTLVPLLLFLSLSLRSHISCSRLDASLNVACHDRLQLKSLYVNRESAEDSSPRTSPVPAPARSSFLPGDLSLSRLTLELPDPNRPVSSNKPWRSTPPKTRRHRRPLQALLPLRHRPSHLHHRRRRRQRPMPDSPSCFPPRTKELPKSVTRLARGRSSPDQVYLPIPSLDLLWHSTPLARMLAKTIMAY